MCFNTAVRNEDVSRAILKAARDIVDAEQALAKATEALSLARKQYRNIVAHHLNGKAATLVVIGPEENELPLQPAQQETAKPADRSLTPGSIADRIITRMISSVSVTNKELVAEFNGVLPHSIRGSLSFLKSKGYIQPMSRGMWAITDAGRKLKESSKRPE